MKTTAYYRTLAREAEQKCEWGVAAMFWKLALEAYPAIPGELAEMDKDKIITAINADLSMVES